MCSNAYISKSIKGMIKIITYLKSTLHSDFDQIIFEIFIFSENWVGGGGGPLKRGYYFIIRRQVVLFYGFYTRIKKAHGLTSKFSQNHGNLENYNISL